MPLRQHVLRKLPGNESGNVTIDRTVRLGDVMPTLLAYAGVTAAWLPGANLVVRSDDAAPSSATAHLDLDGRTGDSIVEGRWHYLRTAEGVALFDRTADPREQKDASASIA